LASGRGRPRASLARLTAALAAGATLVLVAGCGDDSATSPSTSPGAAGREGGGPRGEDAPAGAVAPSRCPPGLTGCRTAEGRIVYVERVDPDGDGDAHFVIADPQGITLRGLTAIDVRGGLRPSPLPGPGELISAAGPVQVGSYGQSQIHAVELHVAGE
jgi:hypothetical protein